MMTQSAQKIIAFVDGSAYAASVCEHAAWISQVTGAPVELIHILGRKDATDTHDHSGAIALGARSALMNELAALDAQRAKLIGQKGRAILDGAQALLKRLGANQTTARLRHGDLVEALAEVETDARLIVVGKRGEAADMAKGHLGSNLERIVRASQKPVFVASRAFKPIAKVLVAYDGGASAMRAVDHIARCRLFQALAVHVVTVGTPTAQMEKGLADAAALLQAAGISPQTSIVQGAPETALANLIAQEQFDMLVMGAYGHSHIRSLIIGSTTTQMIRACKVPVLLHR